MYAIQLDGQTLHRYPQRGEVPPGFGWLPVDIFGREGIAVLHTLRDEAADTLAKLEPAMSRGARIVAV